MKLLLLSLLAVASCVWVSGTVEEEIARYRLDELLVYIKAVGKSMKNEDHLVNTPPQEIQDRCCLTALDCFRSNLRLHFNRTQNIHVKKLERGLRSPVTERTMGFCNSNTTLPTCLDSCHSHPKKSAKEFLQRLESLIQRANANLARV